MERFGTDRDRSGSELSWIDSEAEELLRVCNR